MKKQYLNEKGFSTTFALLAFLVLFGFTLTEIINSHISRVKTVTSKRKLINEVFSNGEILAYNAVFADTQGGTGTMAMTPDGGTVDANGLTRVSPSQAYKSYCDNVKRNGGSHPLCTHR